MVEPHTKLSISSDISSLTSNTEASNTNSDGLMDADGSKLDYEYEVIYFHYLLYCVKREGERNSIVFENCCDMNIIAGYW